MHMYFLAKPFEEVQKRVSDLLKDKILVGHAVHNDLKVRMVHSLQPLFKYFSSRLFSFPILGSKHEIRKFTRTNSL